MEMPPDVQVQVQVQVQQQHFLLVTSPLQGHINPVLRLAARITAANPGARVTFSTAVFAHRRMFPSLGSPDEEVVVDDGAGGGSLLHAPYSDGYDDGYDPKVHDVRSFDATARVVGADTLPGVIRRLDARGRPVTRVVCTFLVAWALDVARAHGVPAALFWIQPATVFAVYYHFFHGHGDTLVATCAAHDDPAGRGGSAVVQLPGLAAPLSSTALPSLVFATSPERRYYAALGMVRGLFSALDEHRPKVLVNTFEALELDALRAVPELELVAVGPVASPPSSSSSTDLVKQDDDVEKEYMQWLGTQAARSVVYVSFGTMRPCSGRQELELTRGLEDTNRPYLWARGRGSVGDHDDLDGRMDAAAITGGEQRQGKVVEWCDQVRMLSHPAVGCFVTHCGWNSALESIEHGVPIVGVPQWTDQPTVAWLVEERAGAGVRAAVDCEGVVERDELRRCVETVMGDGERGAEVRARARWWMVKAREAVGGGGTSEKNIRAFASGL